MNPSPRLLFISAVFITCLIAANTIAVKLIAAGPWTLPAAVIVFPLSYIFGDVLTEVYGFRWARRIIWLGFFCNLIFVFFVWLGGVIPASPVWSGQEAYQAILGFAPRVLLASFAGYLVGEFSNSIILSRLKAATGGRWLWLRTIGSTIIGQGLDTAVFITIAFAGPSFMPVIIIYHWLAKVAIEVAATPLTYLAVNYLKRKDGVDAYDRHVSLNPFSFKGSA
jgi:queuosine precursor transporter